MHPEIERTAKLMRTTVKVLDMSANMAFNNPTPTSKKLHEFAKEAVKTATDNWQEAVKTYTPWQTVIYVPTFEGTNGTLAHVAIVEVQVEEEDLNDYDKIKDLLNHRCYRQLEILTPGAVAVEVASQLAEDAAKAKSLRIYIA